MTGTASDGPGDHASTVLDSAAEPAPDCRYRSDRPQEHYPPDDDGHHLSEVVDRPAARSQGQASVEKKLQFSLYEQAPQRGKRRR